MERSKRRLLVHVASWVVELAVPYFGVVGIAYLFHWDEPWAWGLFGVLMVLGQEGARALRRRIRNRADDS
ncbi:hypothetical protein FHX82_002313 [Amycolatopsis bartoniae]|uniref:Uncharacterized protein n=1 Tax=Amycolatopsis bartoniae TaxID=941986 RepID=A0A8H9IZN6_9PSEU|nr:hypothetical protein [Amycolatopsis bartoniae]MBB2935293.1 hypothetical protein [Amycolatopsis bartoniae]TVT06804.1 hypothetical protein FNH07_18720 [Amycolatopsis bartoniae]GHF55808.1 hypothetical protein GCM10017566_31070 [Amycolatopsis bartoniae]